MASDDKPAAPPAVPAPVAPAVNPVDQKALGSCLKTFLELGALAFLIVTSPFIVIAIVLIWFRSEWVTVWTIDPHWDNALIALASVAGVLWSGAIIAYSIHKKYTPPLRTGVQLLNFAIIAPLIGLVAEGASLRTAFYLGMWFFIYDALFSMSNYEMLKLGKISLKLSSPGPNETAQEVKARQALDAVQATATEFFKRVAHGTYFFAFLAVVCLVTVVFARQDFIAWSCVVVLIVTLFLMLPEIFRLVDQPDEPAPRPPA